MPKFLWIDNAITKKCLILSIHSVRFKVCFVSCIYCFYPAVCFPFHSLCVLTTEVSFFHRDYNTSWSWLFRSFHIFYLRHKELSFSMLFIGAVFIYYWCLTVRFGLHNFVSYNLISFFVDFTVDFGLLMQFESLFSINQVILFYLWLPRDLLIMKESVSIMKTLALTSFSLVAFVVCKYKPF